MAKAKAKTKAAPKTVAEEPLKEAIIPTSDAKEVTQEEIKEFPMTVEEATAPGDVILEETPESLAQAEADHKESEEAKDLPEDENKPEKTKEKKGPKSEYVIDEEKIAAYLSSPKFPDRIVQISQGGNYVSSTNLAEIYVPLSLFKA